MSTFRMIEIVGTSDTNYEDAIRNALKDAKKILQDSVHTLEGYEWFNVLDQRGMIKDGEVKEFQIRLNVGFRIKK